MSQNWKKITDIPQSHLTPMLRQYLAAKAESGDSLLFFRMGDFYELFFEDAIEASRLLGIALTSRDATTKDERIPMAGVPVRSADMYIARCLKAGRTVTICEQIEDPKEAKGVVQRAIVRTITPGTVLAPELLEERANNYLAAITFDKDKAGVAFVDVTTGEFIVAEITAQAERILIDELVRMSPAEILIPAEFSKDFLEKLQKRFPETRFTERPQLEFERDYARDLLLEEFELGTLKGIGLEDAPSALACAGAVLAYIRATQRDAIPQLRLPRRYLPEHFVVLDSNTQRNLELVESMLDRSKKGTLLSVLDRTVTAMGGRKLRHWILHPLVDVTEIQKRLNAVEDLYENATLRLELKETLQGIADLERLTARITAKSATARDLKALGTSLERLPRLGILLNECASEYLSQLRESLDDMKDVAQWINEALVDSPPNTLTEGNLIRDGYHPELDRLRNLVKGGRDWIAALQREEIQRTGIPNLRVGYNKVFGYYIEVTRANVHMVPPDYERKQTLVNAERYVTPALKAREEDIVTAQERIEKLEYELFDELRQRIANEARRTQQVADIVATIDVLLSLAEVAASKNYVKPIVDESQDLYIRDGRHPVVEDLMPRNTFVPNDTLLEQEGARLLIVTGPNMAGKSTYLRQVALITLLAQIGSFVPAAEARIGVVDRIFTRVGAADNLVRGESTFMVEMIETANILNAATERSLIVLDEIGRGTSTFDGISIAWSVAEHIHDRIRAKTLFATHYHELTELASKLEHAKNVNVAVREWNGKVIFLYRIVEGGADHSYGIQVAKLAGLPKSVIERAQDILHSLEAGTPALSGLPEQLYLFGPMSTEPSPIEKELERVDPDLLSPREAHELLYHLKHLLTRPRSEHN